MYTNAHYADRIKQNSPAGTHIVYYKINLAEALVELEVAVQVSATT